MTRSNENLLYEEYIEVMQSTKDRIKAINGARDLFSKGEKCCVDLTLDEIQEIVEKTDYEKARRYVWEAKKYVGYIKKKYPEIKNYYDFIKVPEPEPEDRFISKEIIDKKLKSSDVNTRDKVVIRSVYEGLCVKDKRAEALKRMTVKDVWEENEQYYAKIGNRQLTISKDLYDDMCDSAKARNYPQGNFDTSKGYIIPRRGGDERTQITTLAFRKVGIVSMDCEKSGAGLMLSKIAKTKGINIKDLKSESKKDMEIFEGILESDEGKDFLYRYECDDDNKKRNWLFKKYREYFTEV